MRFHLHTSAPRSLLLPLLLPLVFASCRDNTGPDNRPPEIGSLQVTVLEDEVVRIDVLASANDEDNDVLELLEFTQPAHGQVEGDGAALRYTPEADYHGSDAFSVTISDPHQATVTGDVFVTVTPVNDAPVAVDDAYELSEDQTRTLDVLENDVDVDGDVLRIASTLEPAHGTAFAEAGGLSYVPTAEYNGTDSILYIVQDEAGAQDTGLVTLTIVPVDDPPDAVDDEAEGVEDQALPIDVLANDEDPDGGEVILDGFSAASHGTVANYVEYLIYYPNSDFHGTDAFSYYIRDATGGVDSARVDIIIQPQPDAPVAAPDTAETDEGVPVLIDVLANDIDVDLEPLVVSAWLEVSHGAVEAVDRALRYTPEPGFNGTGGFRYVASDSTGRGDTATVVVRVRRVNQVPVARSDSAVVEEDGRVSLDVLANDSDPDGDPLDVDIVRAVAHGTLSRTSDNWLHYEPYANYNGEDSFEYVATDGVDVSPAVTVRITVEPVNDLPVPMPDSVTVAENESVLIDVLANDLDADGDSLRSAVAPYFPDGIIPPAHGTAAWESEQIRYIPDPSFVGVDSLTYWMSDGTSPPYGGMVYITVTSTTSGLTAQPLHAGAEVARLETGDPWVREHLRSAVDDDDDEQRSPREDAGA